jgi:hypothetical protein
MTARANTSTLLCPYILLLVGFFMLTASQLPLSGSNSHCLAPTPTVWLQLPPPTSPLPAPNGRCAIPESFFTSSTAPSQGSEKSRYRATGLGPMDDDDSTKFVPNFHIAPYPRFDTSPHLRFSLTPSFTLSPARPSTPRRTAASIVNLRLLG